MDASEELAICSHCQKDVVKTNLPMHEAHCQRFLCLCPDCEELMPKDQLEEHREEQHTPVKCKKCNMKMEKCKLADHDANECTERPQSCEYCQLDFPWSKLKEHVVACGSRTELCQDCNKYVTLKDQLQHAQTCTSEDFSFKTKSINGNVKKPLPGNTLQKDEKKKRNEKTGWIDEDQIRTCPHCHLALPVNTLQWHADKCWIAEGLKRMNEAKDASVKK
ncbi:XIAP-associated factor 1 isoform X2 [Ictalurus furcatus]|uniref:XIAP-associated factor 1 isoform X2 n=1 Tax=Ictalurus furcatus TaxID=66913 RepID=UPI00234FCAA9|nr:XIAP-associated factor 1 isoform X2 [Ictalurus furcatus]